MLQVRGHYLLINNCCNISGVTNYNTISCTTTSCTIIINKSGVINNNDTIISCTNSCTNIRVTTYTSVNSSYTTSYIIITNNCTISCTSMGCSINAITTIFSSIRVNTMSNSITATISNNCRVNNITTININNTDIISINGVNNNYGVSINNITITNITDFIVNRVFRLKLLILKITEIFEIT